MEQFPDLAARLDSPDGLKVLLGGGLLGRRAKKNAAQFARATAKGVAKAHGVLGAAIPNHAYEIKVFTTGEADIPADYLAEVKAQAEQRAPQYLRVQSLFYSDEPKAWHGRPGWEREATVFRDLSRPADGIYVYALSHMATGQTTGYVAWAVIDDELKIVQVPDRNVEAILGGQAPKVSWSTGTAITVRN